jgi:SprA-related family
MTDKRIVKVYMASSMNILSLSGYYASIVPEVEGNHSAVDHKNEINEEVNGKNRIDGSDKIESSAKVQELTDAEKRRLELLKKIDSDVRAHELAHITAGGRYIMSGARLQYERGSDGKSYAVAGEVTIDTSPVPGDPRATADKMGVIHRAALAPKDPSPQDRRVAERSSLVKAHALMELSMIATKEMTASTEEPKEDVYGFTNSTYTHQGSEAERGSVIYIEA